MRCFDIVYELNLETEFAAAHRLREYDGDCENLHGHNWRVRLTLASERLTKLGMVVDFRDVKQILGDVLDEFDHAYLNDLDRFRETNPTTENIARCICEELQPRLPDGVRVAAVTAWESPRCSATYRP